MNCYTNFRLLLIVICSVIAFNSSAIEVSITSFKPVGTHNSQKYYEIDVSEIEIHSPEGYKKLTIDGVDMLGSTSTKYYYHTINIESFLNGIPHEVKVTGEDGMTVSFYFSSADSSTDGIYYDIDQDGVAYVNTSRKQIKSCNILSEFIYRGKTYPVTYISVCAFDRCESLEGIFIPSSIESIGESAFNRCTGLNSVTLPENLKSIGYGAFAHCISLDSITIPKGVIEIGHYAFSFCDSLKKLQYNAVNCETFGQTNTGKLFPQNIKKIVIGEEVEIIPDRFFFFGCQVESLVIPNSVKSIGKYAFRSCNNLKSITFGIGLTSIEENAFDRTNIIKAAWLGKVPPEGTNNVKAYINYVVNDEYGLANKKVYPFLGSKFAVNGIVYVPVDNKLCDAIDCTYDNEISNVITPSNVSTRNINLAVRDITPYAFYMNNNVKALEVCNTGEIGHNAFFGCSALTQAKLGDTVSAISDNAFSECTSLEKFTIGSNVKKIGEKAFCNTTNVKELYSLAMNPPICGNQALADFNKWECTLYVPFGCSKSYQNASQWQDFLFLEELDESAISSIEINENMPCEIYNLNGVKITESINNISSGIYIIREGSGVRKIRL